VISLPLGLLRPAISRPAHRLVVRMLLNGIRTVPSLLWALLGVVLVGTNPVAGVLGLSLYSVGYLAKFTSRRPRSPPTCACRVSLRRAGASRVRRHTPRALAAGARDDVEPRYCGCSSTTCARRAIVGYVGAGGIGTWLHTYQEFGQWSRFATVLLVILVVVIVLDLLGEAVRARLRATTAKA
jgi:phosphonate transport system permease protein